MGYKWGAYRRISFVHFWSNSLKIIGVGQRNILFSPARELAPAATTPAILSRSTGEIALTGGGVSLSCRNLIRAQGRRKEEAQVDFRAQILAGISTHRSQAMYIRVKRSKTTYFIQCEPTETSLDIKQKLHDLTDQPVNDQRLILVSTGEVLEDSKTLADQKVENDAVVALAFRKDDNEFEEVNIVRPDDFYQSRDADAGNW
ncbi:hypothetical protein EV1_017220 [Malus domestica]